MTSRYPNSGVLFKNEQKKMDKHPDYTGTAEVAGVEYKLAAWIKQGQKGKFMSISFAVPDPKYAKKPAKDDGTVADMREDLPW